MLFTIITVCFNSEMTIDSREGEYFRVDIKLKNKERTTCTV